MDDVYIYDAVRTPRGRHRRGSLEGTPALHLLAAVLRAVRDRAELPADAIDDVVMGCVEPVGEQGANVGRVGALLAGYDLTVPGVQLNRFCSSGLVACNLAGATVAAGMNDLVVAGGVESMSRVAMGAGGGGWSADPTVAEPTLFVPQGIGADLVATLHGFSRDDVDHFGARSQQRAAAAREAGHFRRSLIPIHDDDGTLLLDHDEVIRPDTTPEGLARLRPSFARLGAQGYDAVALRRYPQVAAIEHVHHAGNSSAIADGAAAVLVGSRAAEERHGLTPRARIRAFASVGSEPTIMLTGPAPAARRALERAGMTPDDIDLWEINEAFAAVVLQVMADLGLSEEVVNVNGGAIAMGHPLGATGAILLGTLLDELERRDLRTGLVTLCVGAGMGTATILERVEA
jgi:acetyl-CoA C-acetyltransferase